MMQAKPIQGQLRPPGMGHNRSFLTDGGFTTEYVSTSDDSSDSDTGLVSGSAIYLKLKKQKLAKQTKDLLESDKKRLAYETKKVDNIKFNLAQQRQELSKWENSIEDHRKFREGNKKMLEEAVNEHKQMMRAELEAITEKERELDDELDALTKQKDEIEKDYKLRSNLLDFGSERVEEMKAEAIDLQVIVHDFRKVLLRC